MLLASPQGEEVTQARVLTTSWPQIHPEVSIMTLPAITFTPRAVLLTTVLVHTE